MKKCCFFILISLSSVILYSPAYANVSALVKVIKLEKKILSDSLTLYGTVKTNSSTNIIVNVPISGKIQKIEVNSGQLVKRGDVLFYFKPDLSAMLNYQQAASALRLAKLQLITTERLYKQQLATRSQLAAAKKTLKDAQIALSTAQELGGDIAIKKITAPFDAIITQLMISPGDHIQSGSALIELGDCNDLVAEVGVDPRNASRIKVGMAVKLQVLNHQRGIINGKVLQISHQINPKTRFINVWISILNSNCNTLYPGSSVQAIIILSSQNLWSVPESAVLKDKQGYYVYRIQNHKAKRIGVKILIRDQGWIGIYNRELSTHDIIVTQGNYELQSGMAVRLASE